MPGQAAAQDELSCARGGTFMRNLRAAQFGGIVGGGYRWTEMWLLVLPSAFMLVGLLTLLLVPTVNNLATPVAHHNLPPLDAFTPAFGLIAALVGPHLLLTIIAPDADQTILPLACTLSSVGVIMSLRLVPYLNQPALGSKKLIWRTLGLFF